MSEDAHIINAESGTLPGQEVPGKVLVEKPAIHQQLDYPMLEDLDHRLEPGEPDIEDRSLVVKSALKHDCVEMRILGAPSP